MQNPVRFGSFAAALALSVAAMAPAANAAVLVARATLATALAEPREAEIAGVTWRCAGAACEGTVDNAGSRRPTAMIACRTLASTVGPVAAFQRAGIEMSGGNLRHCNANAGQ